MDCKIKTRQVHKDIKVLDKTEIGRASCRERV